MCSIGAPELLRKTGEAKTLDYVIGTIGSVLMILSLVGSVYPIPAAPPVVRGAEEPDAAGAARDRA